jgi:hypothetical protein
MVRFLGLLLAFSATACNGGPTEPTFDDLVGIYTGRWRGNINGFELVLDVQAERGRPESGGLVGLDGSATARNPGTGETHRLNVFGQAVGPASTWFRLIIPPEVGPGAVIVRFQQDTGEFFGSVSPDRRTWPGHWTSATLADGPDAAPIFGPGGGPVTLTKD